MKCCILALWILVMPGLVYAQSPGPSLAMRVALYLPNRVLDLTDLVRARLRVGPGLAISARATRPASAFAGAYGALYAGLPGPRGRKLPRLPIGLESQAGAQVSYADLAPDFGVGPDYGSTEFGVGVQLFLLGADVGADPGELFDFVVGFFGFDPKEDDF
jgi:hypothetical protein